jgi:hypothetical protein
MGVSAAIALHMLRRMTHSAISLHVVDQSVIAEVSILTVMVLPVGGTQHHLSKRSGTETDGTILAQLRAASGWCQA